MYLAIIFNFIKYPFSNIVNDCPLKEDQTHHFQGHCHGWKEEIAWAVLDGAYVVGCIDEFWSCYTSDLGNPQVSVLKAWSLVWHYGEMLQSLGD